VLGALAIAGYLLAAGTGSDLTKVVVGGWIAALGNVIGVLLWGAEREVGTDR
jgi:hypothetical protein